MSKAFEVWNKIDSTVVNVIGGRVFYQLTDDEGGTPDPGGRKSLAFVTGKTDERDGQGRLLNRLMVFPCNGDDPLSVTAPLDSARTPGTFDLAKDGDLVN